MDTQKEAYKIEAYELLSELETSLLELEESPDDFDLVDRVFRAMHTIKGSGAMFGFDDIAEFTHDVETAFDLVRDGRIPISTHLVNLALRARDHIKLMLDLSDQPDAIDPKETQSIIDEFRLILENNSNEDLPQNVTVLQQESQDDSDQSGDTAPTQETIYRIRFAPHESLFHTGTNPLNLLAEIEALGDSKIILHTDRLPPASEYQPEACYLYWDILLTTEKSIDTIKDVFIFVEDSCDVTVEMIDTLSDLINDPRHKRLGEILVERGDLEADQIDVALKGQKRLGQLLAESEIVSKEKIDSALAEQNFVQETRKRHEQKTNATSVRVAAEKLDVLVNLVGELVTVQARLSQKAITERDSDLLTITEVVERLTAELRDNTLSIRMLPIDVSFSKLRRLVRDLSTELGKDILLKTEGGDTELDKTVIEQLNDPLIHILRNSIDHGIETPEQRQKAGKPEQGTIHMKAEHSGANVLIHIRDDGAGIDAQTIRKKAIEKGLLSSEADRSDKELLQMIFLPGFSTAGSITNVSGRGVGMDVVKSSIESLRGTIDIQSQKGVGTTITLKLPLTLAIIDGLLVEIDTERYVLPLAAIEECVELTEETLDDTHGRNMLNIRGEIVPFIPLRERFAIEGARPPIEQVVINSVDGQRIGIVVDRVIGEHQIVIKTMNSLYKNVEEISGATILGDGTVALILDIQKLLKDITVESLAA